jgi:hypothetical protein
MTVIPDYPLFIAQETRNRYLVLAQVCLNKSTKCHASVYQLLKTLAPFGASAFDLADNW